MREKKTKNPKKNYKTTNSKNIVKTPVGEIYIFLCLAANSSLYFFMRLSMREKLKIPKKNYKNIKSENIVKLLLRRCIFFFTATMLNASRRTYLMPRGEQFPIFFYETL